MRLRSAERVKMQLLWKKIGGRVTGGGGDGWGPQECAGNALLGDSKVAGRCAQGEGVMLDGNVTEDRAGVEDAATQALAPDLVHSERETLRHEPTEAIEIQGPKGSRRWDDLFVVGGSVQDALDELGRSEDALIEGPILSAATDALDELPATRAASQAAALEIGEVFHGGSLADELAIDLARLANAISEMAEDEIGVLCGKVDISEENGMAGPRIVVEVVDGNGKAGFDGVEVDVADELEEVGLLFDEGVLEAVLEEMSGAVVNEVEGGRVGTEPALNEAREGRRPVRRRAWRWLGMRDQA